MKTIRLIVLMSLCQLFAISSFSQNILGKHPSDKVLDAFFNQNTNANTEQLGLNRSSTVGVTNRIAIAGNAVGLTNVNGSGIQVNTINSNKLDAATRALLGGSAGTSGGLTNGETRNVAFQGGNDDGPAVRIDAATDAYPALSFGSGFGDIGFFHPSAETNWLNGSLAATKVFGDGSGLTKITNGYTHASIAAMLADSTIPMGGRVRVYGYYGTNQIGGGEFDKRNTSDTTNRGKIFNAAGGGQMHRVVASPSIDHFEWYGTWPSYSDATIHSSDAAWQNWYTNSGRPVTLIWPAFRHDFTKTLAISNDSSITIIGELGDLGAYNAYPYNAPVIAYIGATNLDQLQIFNSDTIKIEGIGFLPGTPTQGAITNQAKRSVVIDGDVNIAHSHITTHVTVQNCRFQSRNENAPNYIAIDVSPTSLENVENIVVAWNTIQGGANSDDSLNGTGIHGGDSANMLNCKFGPNYFTHTRYPYYMENGGYTINDDGATGDGADIAYNLEGWVDSSSITRSRFESVKQLAVLGGSTSPFLMQQNVLPCLFWVTNTSTIRITGGTRLTFINNASVATPYARLFTNESSASIVSINNYFPNTNTLWQMMGVGGFQNGASLWDGPNGGVVFWDRSQADPWTNFNNYAWGNHYYSNNLFVTGTNFAGKFSGNGSLLTGLNASSLTGGIMPAARLPGVVTNNYAESLYLPGTTTTVPADAGNERLMIWNDNDGKVTRVDGYSIDSNGLLAGDGSQLTGVSGLTGMRTNQFTTNVVGQPIYGDVSVTNIGAANSRWALVGGSSLTATLLGNMVISGTVTLTNTLISYKDDAMSFTSGGNTTLLQWNGAEFRFRNGNSAGGVALGGVNDPAYLAANTAGITLAGTTKTMVLGSDTGAVATFNTVFGNSSTTDAAGGNWKITTSYGRGTGGSGEIEIWMGGARASGSSQTVISNQFNLRRVGNFDLAGTVNATNGYTSFKGNKAAPTAITVTASPFNWTNNAASTGSGTNDLYVYVDGVSVTGTVGICGGTVFNTIGQCTVALQPGEWTTITYTIGTPTAAYKFK